MKRYGVPYQGSKNAIAEQILQVLPDAHNLYDLFAGGCAITHAAMAAGKYDRYIVNDINDVPLLFVRACNGEYANEQKVKKTIRSAPHSKKAGMCNEERSLISPDYARNFICDFIIGKEQIHTLPKLF